MNRFIKTLAIFFLIIILACITIFGYISMRGIPSYPTVDFKFNHTSDSLVLQRGEKMASMLCAGCHMDPETGTLTGSRMYDAPKEFGIIYSPNITSDESYGIGDWTDAELLYLLRTGIKKDGKFSPPYMAKLPKMADEDINAIIAFLRSDHPLVNAVPKPDKDSEPSFLTKMLSQITFRPFDMPTEAIALPNPNDAMELGEYLAVNLECFSCIIQRL